MAYIGTIVTALLNIIHARLRRECSSLNADLYKVNLSDTYLCRCGSGVENAKDYFLECELYDNIRLSLVRTIAHNGGRCDIKTISYGNPSLNFDRNLYSKKCTLISNRVIYFDTAAQNWNSMFTKMTPLSPCTYSSRLSLSLWPCTLLLYSYNICHTLSCTTGINTLLSTIHKFTPPLPSCYAYKITIHFCKTSKSLK